MDHRKWVVYLLRCSDGSLYCGITNNLKNRLATHNSGKGAKYTKPRRPVELVGASPEMTKSDALKLEYRIKQIPASKKNFELTKGRDNIIINLKKELQTVNKEIKAFAKTIEKIVVAVDKLEKTKKKTVKVKPKKKVVAKKLAAKKSTKATAADAIMEIIKRSKKGVDTAALVEKTGFNTKKIQNIIFKLKKQGKIKSKIKGIYLVA